MRKILLTLHTGYAGMTAHEAYLVPEEVPASELDEWAWHAAVDHAASFGIYPTSDDEEEVESRYSGENIDGYWRTFEEKDAGKVIFGNNSEICWNEY